MEISDAPLGCYDDAQVKEFKHRDKMLAWPLKTFPAQKWKKAKKNRKRI